MILCNHELVKLAHTIDWQRLEAEFGQLYSADSGALGKPIRLLAGLEYLKQIHKLSDEKAVAMWCENPYWQYFFGMQFFTHHMPCDPSSMVRFCKRIGEQGTELMLSLTVDVGLKVGAVKESSLREVVVDSTVMDKNISFPTDSKLLERCWKKLVDLAKHAGITLRQSYARAGVKVANSVSRYAYAKQYKRMRKALKKQKSYLGRVFRDILRKLDTDPSAAMVVQLRQAETLLKQDKFSKSKLYSLHEPHVECIAKGKSAKPYEFGVKVSVATTVKEQFIQCCHAMHGNPYDGDTLYRTLRIVEDVANVHPFTCFVDRGYRGHMAERYEVFIAGQKRGVTPASKKKLKRCNGIEPIIGHMKNDGHLGLNRLRGILGDKLNAIFAGVGQNLRKILSLLRFFYVWILCWFFMPLERESQHETELMG
ncbi:IS5 family transposase [Pseudoalteromonas xiamenensis]|uniref:IS5 family transposase n=1 Tax=Pseudoalteromonas xiamenensis TaxID=882626 RepID=UPI0027E3C041|nr:IS5 family transposase [Pseudoalteromonas xiamenensis]WMN60791.1 IS5 family transposase [Pseudoalteromonas xiamenensis]